MLGSVLYPVIRYLKPLGTAGAGGPVRLTPEEVAKMEKNRFVIVDAAMNDLIRPTLYEAHHPMRPVTEPASPGTEIVDVVGPVCETGDFLALDRPLPPLRDGDLLAIEVAGAYGAVMSSSYNARPLAPELLVRGDTWAVVRPRQTVESLIGLDRLPPWIKPARPKGRNRAPTKKVSRQRNNKHRRRKG